MNNLASYVNRFKNLKVLVIGDIMLDEHIDGSVSRIAPEAPVPVLLQKSYQAGLGGAGNVAANIQSLDAQVTLIGRLGSGEKSKQVKDICEQLNINLIPFSDGQKTTVKTRFFCGKQLILRADTEEQRDISEEIEHKIIDHIKTTSYDCIVISDYAKGVVTPKIMQAIDGKKTITVGDVKPHHIEMFKNTSYILPNVKELTQIGSMLGRPEDDKKDDLNQDVLINDLLRHVESKIKGKVILTRSEKGISYVDDKTLVTIPQKVEEVADVTGAGDSTLAAFALAITSGAPTKDAVTIANMAGHAVVQHIGVVTVSPDMLLNASNAMDASDIANYDNSTIHNHTMISSGLKVVYARPDKKNPEKLQPKSILIVKVGAMGDTLMGTPFLDALRARYPKARIDYYIGKNCKDMIVNNPNLTNVYTFDPNLMYQKRALGLRKLAKGIAKQKYDMGIILDKHWMSGIFLRMCKPKVAVGYDRNGEGFMFDVKVPYNNSEHETDQYLNVAYALGAKPPKDIRIQTHFTKKQGKQAEDFIKEHKIKNFITIAPGGAQNIGVGIDTPRRLPTKAWIKVIDQLAKDHQIILYGGDTDKEYYEHLISKIKNKKNVFNAAGIRFINATPFFEIAKLFLCNDSGPMHVASATAKKIVALFGASSPPRKAPRHVRCIAIWKAADQKNYQGDYEMYGVSPEGEFMQTITPKDILDAVNDLLKEKKPIPGVEIRD